MKTKAKSPRRTVKRTAKKKPVAAPAATAAETVVHVVPEPPAVVLAPSSPVVFTETTETHVRFFNPGESEPFSVIHNGPEGSDNAANVAHVRWNLDARGITVKERS